MHPTKNLINKLLSVYFLLFHYYLLLQLWGRSSAGRALEWHSRGHRFDPDRLHHAHWVIIFCIKLLRSRLNFGVFIFYATFSIPTINCSKSMLKSIFNLYPLKTSTLLIRQFTIIFFSNSLIKSDSISAANTLSPLICLTTSDLRMHLQSHISNHQVCASYNIFAHRSHSIFSFQHNRRIIFFISCSR